MNKLFIWLAVILLGIVTQSTFAQTNLSQPVPVDPALRYGVLENGLTYYIRHNVEPKERASFYIIQNVGALLEEDNQNGLAHFLEHMAFNGTENFEGKGILNTLQNHGVAFGRNINAYTAFNETVYNLSDVPTTHDGLIDTCLLILHDWTDYLLLTEEEIDLERGVITEEWRTRRNANFRMRSQWFPVVFKGSKWAVRDIIGDTTVIRYHEPETLRQFYHDWYRTDLQAIAIVGDVNVDEVEAKVKKLFSEVKPVENKKPRPKFTIPEHKETYFVLATDPEATQTQINLYIPESNNDGEEKTLEDLRDHYMTNLYNSMASLRIQELLQKGTPPFVAGAISKGSFVRGYDVFSVAAITNPGQEDKALEAIMIETERIKRFGFLDSELERAKINFLTNIESQYKQRDKISNDSYCSEYAGNYTVKEPIPGIEFEFEFAKQVIPAITASEINAKSKAWIKTDNRTIVITGPSEGVTHLTEQEAKAILSKVESMEIEPYVDAASGTSLISEELKGAKVVATKKLDDFNAVEWTLANNVKVIYRHADYEKDAVAISAYSKGGTSLWDDEFLPSAEMSQTFINTYGVGDFDMITLQKMLAGKKVSLSPQIGDLTEGFSGSSTPKDFETMMQLLYLYFEKPRFDKEAHDALMSRYVAYVANIEKDPSTIMNDSLTHIITNYNPRVRTLGTKYLNDVNFETIERVYRDRIKDAGDFTFFIVGNIDEETAKEMSMKYLGSLTDSPREEDWKDRGIDNPEGKTEKTIPIALTTPKANVNIRYVKDIDYSQKNSLTMQVLRGILNLRYIETVREDEGGSYGVGISGSVSHYPTSKGTVRITFDCDPARAESLKPIIYREINKVIEEGPIKEDFDKTISNMLKDREQSKEHNGYWLSSLYNYYFNGINTAAAANYEDILNAMTQKDVQKFAKDFFTDADLMDIVFVPKSE